MTSISSEAKVGLFVLVGMIILAYMSFQVGQYGFGLRKGYLVDVVFDNVAGLEKDASVQIAGVEVGRVESIGLRNGKALVAMRIEPRVKLEQDVTATIKTHGILGDKYIEIIPGTNRERHLEEGSEITRVEQQGDVDKLLRELGLIAEDVKAVTASLRKVVGQEEGVTALKAILDNTRDLTGHLNTVVQQNEEKFSFMLDNLGKASKEIEKTFATLSTITDKINKGEGTVGQLVNNGSVFDKLDNTLASLQDITDKIKDGKGSIGKLVNDEETVDNLNTTLKTVSKGVEGINKFVTKADQFRTILSYRGEYLFDKSDGKSYLDLRIQPKWDKYYVLGIVSDPRGRRTITDRTVNGITTRTEEWDKNGLLFNLQIAKRYRDLVFRGGLFESTGGVGIDYYALNDDLKVTFEAFDFSAERRTHLKTYAEYQLLKHLYLSAGWDDFISDEDNSSPFVGFSIKFDDEDVKYLLTSTPLPK